MTPPPSLIRSTQPSSFFRGDDSTPPPLAMSSVALSPSPDTFMPPVNWVRRERGDRRDRALAERINMTLIARQQLLQDRMFVLGKAEQPSWGDKVLLCQQPNNLFALASRHCDLSPQQFASELFKHYWDTTSPTVSPVWAPMC